DLLAASPALDLSLRRKRLVTAAELLGPDQHHRPPVRVAGQESLAMCRQPRFEIVRVSGVEGPVSTSEYVHPGCHAARSAPAVIGSMAAPSPLRSPFVRLRVSGR